MAVLEEQTLSSIPQLTMDNVKTLHELSSITPPTCEQDWDRVASNGREIANGLRAESLRTALGQTTLIKSCGTLLASPGLASTTPTFQRLAQTELLRIVGNLCFDHDINRALCHTAVLPALLSLLHQVVGTKDSVNEEIGNQDWQELSLTELTLLRAGVGALLNMSLKYEPVRLALSAPMPLSLLLALLDCRQESPVKNTRSIYTVGEWVKAPEVGREEWEQRIEIGSTVVGWSMNILEDLLEGGNYASLPAPGLSLDYLNPVDKEAFPSSHLSCLASILLEQPAIPSSPFPWDDEEEIADYLETDLQLMTSTATLLEALSIDLDSIKIAIATQEYTIPTRTPDEAVHSTSLLSHLFEFITSASSPTYWSTITPDLSYGQKPFSLIKSAIVRSVIESPNSDEVMNRLMRVESNELTGKVKKIWVVVKLIGWIEVEVKDREDLLILASHMLAALARKDEHCLLLVQEYGLARPLAKLLISKVKQQFIRDPSVTRPGEVTQILFGVVSLLRHLAIPLPNKQVLGDEEVEESVVLLLRAGLDIVSPLQTAAIGLLKQLTVSSLSNSLRIVASTLPNSPPLISSTSIASTPATPLDMILALIKRTDDVRLRSESTRILVNVVRSLFSSKPISISDLAITSPITPSAPSSSSSPIISDPDEVMRRKGKAIVVMKEVVEALSEMVRLSEKYPMLINEGIVGLTLLAGSGEVGALLVLEALLSSHKFVPATITEESDSPLDAPSPSSKNPRAPQRTTSLAVSPLGDPSTSLGMLVNWLSLAASSRLSSPSNPAAPTATVPGAAPSSGGAGGVQAGMVSNVCALLITVLRGGEVARTSSSLVQKVKREIVGVLEGIRSRGEIVGEEALWRAVGRLLEIVKS